MSWKYRTDETTGGSPDGGYRRFVTNDVAFANATGGTAAAVTGLSFPIKAGETYSVRVNLLTTGVSGGGKFSVSGPASPSLLKITTSGPTSGITAYSTDTITALDTLTAAYNTSAVSGIVKLTIVIGASVDGTVSINAANVTNSNSFAILAGSTLLATKLN